VVGSLRFGIQLATSSAHSLIDEKQLIITAYVLTDKPTNMSESLPPRRLPSLLLFALAPLPAWFVLRPLVDPVPPLPALYVSVGFSIFALLATIYLVPALGPTFVKANLKGRDLLKDYNTPM
jgi:hypothetical protein